MVRRGGKSWNTPPHEVNPNKPDSPLSLMEGAAGVLCYLLVCRKTVTRTSRRPLLGLRGSARKLRGQQESATRRVDLNLVRVYRSLMQMVLQEVQKSPFAKRKNSATSRRAFCLSLFVVKFRAAVINGCVLAYGQAGARFIFAVGTALPGSPRTVCFPIVAQVVERATPATPRQQRLRMPLPVTVRASARTYPARARRSQHLT